MSGRQQLLTGTEEPPEHLRLDLDRLQAFLAPRLEGLDGPLTAAKFKGGQSNPTYLVTGPGARYVLRRKPPGPLVASAHAIDREYQVYAAVSAAGIPVPRPYLYCDDSDVVGTEFYVAEHVEGRVFWDAELPGMTPDERAAIYDDLARVLAAIHDLDPDAIGLGDLARREGYVRRNFERWAKGCEASRLVAIPDMDWLLATLPDRLPADVPAAVLHGDFGLYNVIVDGAEPRVRAVLDWEMATLGDPLVDLAHHLRAWWEPRDDTGAATSLAGRDLAPLGIPTADEQVAAYARHRGIPLPDLSVYLAYAQFRYAAMIQGILKRAATGTAAARTVLHNQDRVVAVARLARRTLEEGLQPPPTRSPAS